MSKYDYITEELKKGFKKAFEPFSIVKDSIEPKTSKHGEIYYDFIVKWKGQEGEGTFQYWPYTKGWKKGYVEIDDHTWWEEWSLDGPILELANGKLTNEMYEYHNNNIFKKL